MELFLQVLTVCHSTNMTILATQRLTKTKTINFEIHSNVLDSTKFTSTTNYGHPTYSHVLLLNSAERQICFYKAMLQ